MTGAIEFLRKAKAICKEQATCGIDCPLDELCGCAHGMTDEADLVRKVMDYRLEDKDAKKI
jgi:hypothetical protein